METGTDYVNKKVNKSKGSQRWIVAVACSVIIAVGLGVGLGVGLSQNSVKNCDPSVPITSAPAETTTQVSTPAAPPGGGPWENYRLPDYIIPSHYELKLHPNMSTDTYTGSNAMTISISQATEYILVHVDANLVVTSVFLAQFGSGESLTPVNIIYEFREADYEFYVIQTEIMLEPAEYLLIMEFEGSLIGKVVGLYKAEYRIPDTGDLKAMVGSDMEPTDARKAYPCFDEPAMKIRFTTTLVHLPEHVALSNMNEESRFTRPDGLIETTFNESVPMSSYLGCFAIGDFVYLERISEKNQIPLRVYIPPHQEAAGSADYAMNVMKTQFDFYEKLFDIDYSLPKLDMISIPNFGTGAMENWGLITFRETNMLWDSQESSTYNKQRVAAVVAHELVHQWFGNLVTMKWWDNIWLNEGFASYLEYFGEDVAEPDWNIMDHVVIDDLQRVLLSDDSVTSRSIISGVTTPSEITSVFDTTTYSKGASLLRYMYTVLGNDTFFGGIQNYLRNRQFSNADEQDLFNDVQEYVDLIGQDVNVAELMNPWVHQMGFPVLTVDSSTGTVTQDHFLIDPNANRSARPVSDYDYKWNIQLTHITSVNETVQETYFERESGNVALEFDVLGEGEWLKLNPGETGYYRVKYDETMWATIIDQLMTNHTVLSEIDRSNLIDDAFNLAPAQLISYEQALNATRYLENERSYFVWYAFNRGSSYIQEMLKSSEIYPLFQEYYLQKVKPTADELGWNASLGSHVDKRNRVLVLSLALEYGDTEALNQANQYFLEWINDENYYLYPDIRELVYTYGVKEATETEWEEMLMRYLGEDVASEKSNLLRGITSVENVAWLDKMLDNCWNESVVRSGDFFSCVTYISYTTIGNQMAWTWIQLNWERMVDRFGIADRNLGNLIPGIISDYNTEIQLWEVESFFERYPEAGAGESGRASALNSIRTNIQWMEQNQDTIKTWLESQNEIQSP